MNWQLNQTENGEFTITGTYPSYAEARRAMELINDVISSAPEDSPQTTSPPAGDQLPSEIPPPESLEPAMTEDLSSSLEAAPMLPPEAVPAVAPTGLT